VDARQDPSRCDGAKMIDRAVNRLIKDHHMHSLGHRGGHPSSRWTGVDDFQTSKYIGMPMY